METVLLLQSRQYFFRQDKTACAALLPYLGKRELTASLLTEILNIGKLRLGICQKSVQRHHHRYAVFFQIFDMFFQIEDPRLQRLHILCAQILLFHTAVIFKRPHRRHQHHPIGL